MRDIILSVRNLNVKFSLRGRTLHAIRGINLDVYRSESLAIVGESGSGKSVLNKNFIGLLDSNGFIDGGEIRYYTDAEKLKHLLKQDEDGRTYVDLASIKKEKDWLKLRGSEICMIPQDPMTSLNPLKTIGAQLTEAILLHRGLKGAKAREACIAILNDVRIDNPEKRYKQYPHELSGGMRQRIVIAIAIACRPQILICDEPTTALDVTIQAQVLSLLKELKAKYKLTILFITHDLGVVANVAERVAVLYAGDIVEIGKVDEIYFSPAHPYTWALLSSLPQLSRRGGELYAIKGTPPNLFKQILGDPFAPRNPHALKIDHMAAPPYFDITETHKARTWLLDPRAPALSPPDIIQNIKSLGADAHDQA